MIHGLHQATLPLPRKGDFAQDRALFWALVDSDPLAKGLIGLLCLKKKVSLVAKSLDSVSENHQRTNDCNVEFKKKSSVAHDELQATVIQLYDRQSSVQAEHQDCFC